MQAKNHRETFVNQLKTFSQKNYPLCDLSNIDQIPSPFPVRR